METYVGHVLVASVIVNLTTCLKISLNDGDDLCEELLMVFTYSFGKKGITFAKSFKKKVTPYYEIELHNCHLLCMLLKQDYLIASHSIDCKKKKIENLSLSYFE